MNLNKLSENIVINLMIKSEILTHFIMKFSTISKIIRFWIKQKFWKIKKIIKPEIEKTIPIWTRLEIDIQSDCNRDCFFCPRYKDRSGIRKDSNGKHIKKSMPTWKIKDILDQTAKLGFKGRLAFHRLSEPFLDNRYIELAKYAKNKGIKIHENTNGDILKKNTNLCNKLDGLLDTIVIGLYDYKNGEERKKQMKFWKNRFKKTHVLFSLAAEYPRIRKNSKLYDKKMVTEKIRNKPCYATNGLRVRYDGEVSLCCQDDQCKAKLGNVFKSSIKDIWWSKKHIKIVNTLKSPGGRKLVSVCKNCVSGPGKQ